MRLNQAGVLSAAVFLCLPFTALASFARPEPKTAAAVIADDDGWSRAEETGDVSYINHLLLPAYRSVNADGSVHDKAAILAGAKKKHRRNRAVSCE